MFPKGWETDATGAIGNSGLGITTCATDTAPDFS
jgi:hypothetical protein